MAFFYINLQAKMYQTSMGKILQGKRVQSYLYIIAKQTTSECAIAGKCRRLLASI